MKKYWIIFSRMFLISSFTFGGGYVVIPMIRKYFVEDEKLLGEKDLLDMAAISQSSPGAIAVNLSVLVGNRICGTFGIFLAAIATILPPMIIISVISMFYTAFQENRLISNGLKGMEAAVLAMIVDYIINMIQTIIKSENRRFVCLVPIAFFANFFLDVSVALILLCTIIISIGYGFYLKKGEKKC